MFKKAAVIFAIIFVLVGCNKGFKEIKQVRVYEMSSFSEMKEDSLTTYTDSDIVRKFINGFKNAKKEPGIVDMADPEYKVELGDEVYFLWTSEDHGTIMNLNDTNTIYTLSKRSAKLIHEVLKQE